MRHTLAGLQILLGILILGSPYTIARARMLHFLHPGGYQVPMVLGGAIVLLGLILLWRGVGRTGRLCSLGHGLLGMAVVVSPYFLAWVNWIHVHSPGVFLLPLVLGGVVTGTSLLCVWKYKASSPEDPPSLSPRRNHPS